MEVLDLVYKICFYSIIPMILLLAVSLTIMFILSFPIFQTLQKNSFSNMIVTLTIPTFLCLAVFPVRTMKRNKISIKDFFICIPNTKNTIRRCMFYIFVSFAILIVAGCMDSFKTTFWMFFIHYLSVAVSEEVLARGVILYYLKQLFRLPVAIIISALIFAFVFHSNSNQLMNLCVRFPLGLIFSLITERTKSILPSICLHWGYDVLVTILSIY